MHHLLEVLRSDEFYYHDSLLMILPPSPMRRVLQRSSFVQDINNALKSGEITESDIREFAASIRIEPGKKSIDDEAVAAVAVALEDIETDFANEYINDLAALKLSEIVLATHIARDILRQKEKEQQEVPQEVQQEGPQEERLQEEAKDV